MTNAFTCAHHNRFVLIDDQYVITTYNNYKNLLAISALSVELGKSFQSICTKEPICLEEVKSLFCIAFSSLQQSTEKVFSSIAIEDIKYIASFAETAKCSKRLTTNLLRRINQLSIPSENTTYPLFHDDSFDKFEDSSYLILNSPNNRFNFPSFVTYYTWRGDNIIFYHTQNHKIVIDRILRKQDHFLFLFERF